MPDYALPNAIYRNKIGSQIRQHFKFKVDKLWKKTVSALQHENSSSCSNSPVYSGLLGLSRANSDIFCKRTHTQKEQKSTAHAIDAAHNVAHTYTSLCALV